MAVVATAEESDEDDDDDDGRKTKPSSLVVDDVDMCSQILQHGLSSSFCKIRYDSFNDEHAIQVAEGLFGATTATMDPTICSANTTTSAAVGVDFSSSDEAEADYGGIDRSNEMHRKCVPIQCLEISNCPELSPLGVKTIIDAIATCHSCNRNHHHHDRHHSKRSASMRKSCNSNLVIQITRLDIDRVNIGDAGLDAITNLLLVERQHAGKSHHDNKDDQEFDDADDEKQVAHINHDGGDASIKRYGLYWLGLEKVAGGSVGCGGANCTNIKLDTWKRFFQVAFNPPTTIHDFHRYRNDYNSLKYLNLSRNNLSAEHIITMVDCIVMDQNCCDSRDHGSDLPNIPPSQKCPCKLSLESLILSENPNIGDIGIQYLCSKLLNQSDICSKLRLLAIGDCGITTLQTMESLIDCLRTSNCHLERIYIYSNPIAAATRDSVVGFYDSKLYDEFEYYLELNAHGQRALIRSICQIDNTDYENDNTDDTQRALSKNVNVNGTSTHIGSRNNDHNNSASNATKMDGRTTVRSSLAPYVLARVNNQPELIYGLLLEAPYVWC